MRIGQPGVERDHGHLDRERQCERQEHPELEVRGETAASLDEVGQRQRARARCIGGREVDGDDAHEHEERPRKGEQNELKGRVDAPRAAPHPDDQVHRQEHQLEEHIEEEKVERDEDPDHADLEQEE